VRGDSQFDFENNPPLKHISGILDAMRADNDRSADNVLLMDIKL
jgi:hypothetical protein